MYEVTRTPQGVNKEAQDGHNVGAHASCMLPIQRHWQNEIRFARSTQPATRLAAQTLRRINPRNPPKHQALQHRRGTGIVAVIQAHGLARRIKAWNLVTLLVHHPRLRCDTETAEGEYHG
jgi:hypothetical protein